LLTKDLCEAFFINNCRVSTGISFSRLALADNKGGYGKTNRGIPEKGFGINTDGTELAGREGKP